MNRKQLFQLRSPARSILPGNSNLSCPAASPASAQRPLQADQLKLGGTSRRQDAGLLPMPDEQLHRLLPEEQGLRRAAQLVEEVKARGSQAQLRHRLRGIARQRGLVLHQQASRLVGRFGSRYQGSIQVEAGVTELDYYLPDRIPFLQPLIVYYRPCLPLPSVVT